MNAAIAFARDSRRVRENRTAQALSRFAEPYRPAVTALAQRHPALADLAISFPAMLFGLAVPRRRFDPEPAIGYAIAGASLPELSAMAAIPMWTRKLHPLAFQSPLPALPDSFNFRRQIVNHLPRRPKSAKAWLQIVSDAARWGTEDLAIWYARHCEDHKNEYVVLAWRLIAVWAWHCAHPAAPASAMLCRRWTPNMSPVAAFEAAERWKDGVCSLASMGENDVTDNWAEEAVVDGYAFEPIRTARQLAAAADALGNCSRYYGSGIAGNWRRMWLVRKDDALVAMLQLSANQVIHISELSGPNNNDVSAECGLAAQRWFQLHCPPRVISGGWRSYLRSEWMRIWRPYWLTKRAFPSWLRLSSEQEFSQWLPPYEPTQGGRRRRRRRRLA